MCDGLYSTHSHCSTLCAVELYDLCLWMAPVTWLVLSLINPRRACAERVTVVVSYVCLSVCMSAHTLFWQYAQLEV